MLTTNNDLVFIGQPGVHLASGQVWELVVEVQQLLRVQLPLRRQRRPRRHRERLKPEEALWGSVVVGLGRAPGAGLPVPAASDVSGLASTQLQLATCADQHLPPCGSSLARSFAHRCLGRFLRPAASGKCWSAQVASCHSGRHRSLAASPETPLAGSTGCPAPGARHNPTTTEPRKASSAFRLQRSHGTRQPTH